MLGPVNTQVRIASEDELQFMLILFGINVFPRACRIMRSSMTTCRISFKSNVDATLNPISFSYSHPLEVEHIHSDGIPFPIHSLHPAYSGMHYIG